MHTIWTRFQRIDNLAEEQNTVYRNFNIFVRASLVDKLLVGSKT